MKKNVAGQKIGAQMITAADGTAFTGAVTVEVTLDAGTQATGSVGSGACAHEGNGYHTYAPAQAETNGDLLAFTFHGTGAIPTTVQVFTAFPQTGDSFALIGATGSGLTTLATQASVNTVDDFLDTEVAAILAAVDTEVGAIKTKTDFLPSATAGAAGGVFIAGSNAATSITAALTANVIGNVTGNLSGSVGSVTGAVGSVTGLTAADVGAIKANTDNLPPDPADASDIATAFAAVPAAVWAAGTRTLTSFGTLVADVATAVWASAARTLTAFSFTVSGNVTQIGGSTATLDRLKRVTDSEILGTVGAASTTTSIVTSSLDPAAIVADQFKGRIVLFDRATSTTALRGQGTRITASATDGILTVEALTSAPASGDTFTIV